MTEASQQELQERIAALSDSDAAKVLNGLAGRLFDQAKAAHADNPEAVAALAEMAESGGEPVPLADSDSVMTPDARALLSALAAMPEYAGDIRASLEQSQFVAFTGLEPLLIATAVTFFLSTKFDFSVHKEDGKWKVDFKISKEPTDLGYIGKLLGIGVGKA